MVPLDEKKHHVVSLATSYYSDLITVTVAGANTDGRPFQSGVADARVARAGVTGLQLVHKLTPRLPGGQNEVAQIR